MHPDSFLARLIDGRQPRAPIMDLLGWQFTGHDAETGTLTAEMEARPEFLNPAGSVHGGMLAAMLDETLAPTVAAALGPDEFAPTIEIKVSFIAPARGGRILAKGRLVNKGRSICFAEAELRDESGRLLATATATSKITSSVKPIGGKPA